MFAESLGGPRYLQSLQTGTLAKRAVEARRHLSACDLCARRCGVDRMQGLAGAACRTGALAVVGSYGAHFGEEAPLSGRFGSGTIFFGGCNMRCLYCQNWQLSWKTEGREVSAAELAGIMLRLQDEGCHNINLVSPSHVVAQILEALVITAERGLRLPLVYNSGGYDSPEALALLDGVIDIYMPDVKYGDSDVARKYSKVRDYVEANDAALKEMHRQVGDLLLDDDGLAVRGLLVRHLVLPSDIAGSDRVLRFLAEEISTDTYLNIMAQYRPHYRAGEKPELDRRPTRQEVAQVFELARQYGLHRLDDRGPARILYW
jgi:putative pyruvate formate lyase activating enzyme